METKYFVICIALISAFFAAAALVPQVAAGMREKFSSNRIQSKALGEKSGLDSLLRNGVVWLKPLVQPLLKYEPINRYLRDTQLIFEAKKLNSTCLSIGSLFCLALLVAFVVGAVLGSSWLFGIILGGGLVVAAVSLINHQKELREEAIRETVPDALRSMSVCSHVGLSLQQSFDQVASEIDGPLKQLFVHAANDLATGKTVSDALTRFQSESHVDELSFVAVALDVQHKAGGSLRQVLDAARDSVESELELRRNLRVQTAQAKLSARIVSLMPFVLLALFSFLSPGFLSPFFGSIEGFALLGLAVIMQVSGILLVRHTLDVGRN